MSKVPTGRNSRSVDITDQPFGNLVAVRFVGYAAHSKQLWEFRCLLCDSLTIKRANSVMADAARGNTPSCGCQQFKGGRRTHGKHGTREYHIWKQMKQRCHNPNYHQFHNYGGRGIKVCSRWRQSFANFLADLGSAPSVKHTIERIKNHLGYSPDNCVWETRKVQSRNKRDNRILELDGRSMVVTDWAIEMGLDKSTLFKRLDAGWSTEKALLTPPEPRSDAVVVEFSGKSLSLRQWAKETGIPFQTLYYRIVKAGWTAEKALTKTSSP